METSNAIEYFAKLECEPKITSSSFYFPIWNCFKIAQNLVLFFFLHFGEKKNVILQENLTFLYISRVLFFFLLENIQQVLSLFSLIMQIINMIIIWVVNHFGTSFPFQCLSLNHAISKNALMYQHYVGWNSVAFDSAENIIISMEIIKRKNDAMECKIVLVAFESMVSVQKYRKK